MDKKLSLIGIVSTVVYLISFYLLISNRINNIQTLSLNELGDFFAGAFGPLAILWLILGFFQQGVELRQNTSALELQAEELKHSVEQQKQLVEVSKQQFNAEIEALKYEREQQRKAIQPVFVSLGIGVTRTGDKSTFKFNIRNVGNTATDVYFSFNREMRMVRPDRLPSFKKDQDFDFSFEYMDWLPEENTILTVNYVDSLGVPGTCEYKLVPDLTAQYPNVAVEKMQ